MLINKFFTSVNIVQYSQVVRATKDAVIQTSMIYSTSRGSGTTITECATLHTIDSS